MTICRKIFFCLFDFCFQLFLRRCIFQPEIEYLPTLTFFSKPQNLLINRFNTSQFIIWVPYFTSRPPICQISIGQTSNFFWTKKLFRKMMTCRKIIIKKCSSFRGLLASTFSNKIHISVWNRIFTYPYPLFETFTD